MAERFDLTRWPGRDQIVKVDNRRISLRHFGAEGGLPVVLLHGLPGSRIVFAATDLPAHSRGMHIIALDRWAYGDTDPPPVPTLDRFADDVVATLDQLGCNRFAIAGVSGGGPYAAAAAVRYPKHVSALALISPVGVVGEACARGEVDAFHRFCFNGLARAPRTVDAIFRAYAGAVKLSAGLACGLTTARAPAADKAILADCATSDRLLAAFHEGLKHSGRGPAIDLALFRDLESLDLSRATAPAHVWIGTADRNVPMAAAKRLADRLPRADLTILDGAGHLWIAHNYGAVLDWIGHVSAEPVPRALPTRHAHG
jgi:pimeloyl-ACP methyl ester carboxylesterase